MPLPLVGIIANPASGRDIRRLVAHGTVFDNNEKMAIVRRALLGLYAVGGRRVAYMPELDFGIVERALAGQNIPIEAEPLSMPVLGTDVDSTRAAQLLAEAGAGCIITLGGDGTNRAAAKGCGCVPLIPISTGTNNVFPSFLEGTLAGMAAGLVAAGLVGRDVVRRAPWLEVLVDGQSRDRALVDVVVSAVPFIGARAVWDLSQVREAVLSQVRPGTIGLSSLGGALLDGAVPEGEVCGMHILLGGDGRQVLVPLAPGLISWVSVRAYSPLCRGESVRLQTGTGTVALDGEREIELAATSLVEVRLRDDGPFVVDVPAALAAAARAGHFRR
ncbi:MAG TPA: NAD(+)/NADH kinase [Ktedonobacteraceae bacterium]|nr:NAD(+)/NADH kinase [Ktedonobacteraceae bacterium]